MPIKQRWTIPNDYSETETQWRIVTMCVPDTRQWRGVVTGAIYNLTRGRHWDETTGIIKVAQVIGQRIFGSMKMDCNNDFGRLADALEAINNKTPELKTLEEILTDMGASSVTDLADLTRILSWVGDMFPGLIPHMPVSQWLAMITGWRRHRETMGQFTAMNASLRGLALAETGETGVEIIDEVTDSIWATLDTIISTAASAGDLLAGLGILGQLFLGLLDGYESDDPDNEAKLRALVNVTLEQGGFMATQTNTQIVTCSGGAGLSACSGTGVGSTWVPDETPTDSPIDGTDYGLPAPGAFPSDFDNQGQYQEYKCKASNAMYFEVGETLFNLYDVKNNSLDSTTISTTISGIAGWLNMVSGGVIAKTRQINQTFQEVLGGWLADALGVKIFQDAAPDDLDVFLDLRLAWLNDKQNVVCAMWNSEGVSECRAALLVLIDGYLSGLSYPADVDTFARGACSDFLSNHYLGNLFSLDETYDAFTDTSAIDCAVCSDYIYPTGTCSTTHTEDNNSADGDGQRDDLWAGPYPYASWSCVFDTPLVINADMTIGVYYRLLSGPYHNWRIYVTVNSIEYDLGGADYEYTAGRWAGNPIDNALIGQTLTAVRFRSYDSGLGPNPLHEIDGLRVGGYVP